MVKTSQPSRNSIDSWSRPVSFLEIQLTSFAVFPILFWSAKTRDSQALSSNHTSYQVPGTQRLRALAPRSRYQTWRSTETLVQAATMYCIIVVDANEVRSEIAVHLYMIHTRYCCTSTEWNVAPNATRPEVLEQPKTEHVFWSTGMIQQQQSIRRRVYS